MISEAYAPWLVVVFFSTSVALGFFAMKKHLYGTAPLRALLDAVKSLTHPALISVAAAILAFFLVRNDFQLPLFTSVFLSLVTAWAAWTALAFSACIRRRSKFEAKE